MNPSLLHVLDQHRDPYRAAAPDPVPVTTLGIPTRNRPVCLARCLTSYLENARRHERSLKGIVVDDARDPASAEPTKAIVEKLARQYAFEITLIDRPQRFAWAKRLARETGTPGDLVRFALLGDDRFATSYGAARNTLLLATAGLCTLQVDDDTVCRLTRTEAGDSRALELTSRYEVGAYRFYTSRSEALAALPFQEEDFIALHESLLGRHPCAAFSTISTETPVLDVPDAPEDFVRRLVHPNARVLKTFLGVRGDSGMRNSQNRLFLKDDSFRTLTDDPATYALKLRTREILRSAARLTIGDTYVMQTINLGLDNRELLPPFPPVLRFEDGVFGSLIKLCWPLAFNGYLPYALNHEPDPPRTVDDDQNSISPGVNDLLAAVLGTFSSGIRGEDAVLNLQMLGLYLIRMGALSMESFRDYLVQMERRKIELTLERMDRILEDEEGRPAHWREDFEALKTRYMQRLAEPEALALAFNLEGSPEQRLVLTQELFSKYGALLRCWPELVEAARHLSFRLSL